MYFWDELNSDDYINRGEEKSHADASAILNLCRGRNNGCYGMVHKSGWFEFMNMPISAAYHPKYHTTIFVVRYSAPAGHDKTAKSMTVSTQPQPRTTIRSDCCAFNPSHTKPDLFP